MAGGADSATTQAFGYGQNVAPAAGLTGQPPQWQQGLMGALTGSAQYGKNAPMIHQMLGGLFKQQQPQQAPMPQRRPMMGAPQIPQMGAPQMPMGQSQVPVMAPWMGGM